MLTLSHNHTRYRQAVAAFILIFIASLFLAPAAFAGCKNNKGKCNQPPNPTPASPGNSIAYFDDSNIHLEEGGAFLECNSEVGNIAGSGSYFCTGENSGALPLVHLTTLGFTGLYSNKDEEDCKALQYKVFRDDHAYAMLEPDTFTYGWVDDCTDTSCRIEIKIAFSGPEILEETGVDADEMTVILGGVIVDTPVDEPNPFLRRTVEVWADGATIEYRQSGRKRAVAVCPFGIWAPDPRYHVLFISEDDSSP